MTKQEKHDIARTLFVSGKDMDTISGVLACSLRTIQNYKNADEGTEQDWDKLRLEAGMKDHTRTREYLFSDFLGYMYDTVREIRESEASPAIKAEKLVQVGDAFSKMQRVARTEDPEAYIFGIVKKTIETLSRYLREKEIPDSCMELIIEAIVDAQEELLNVSL